MRVSTQILSTSCNKALRNQGYLLFEGDLDSVTQEAAKGYTPTQLLFWAAENDDATLFKMALEKGADFNAINIYGQDFFRVYVCNWGRKEIDDTAILQYIIQNNPELLTRVREKNGFNLINCLLHSHYSHLSSFCVLRSRDSNQLKLALQVLGLSQDQLSEVLDQLSSQNLSLEMDPVQRFKDELQRQFNSLHPVLADQSPSDLGSRKDVSTTASFGSGGGGGSNETEGASQPQEAPAASGSSAALFTTVTVGGGRKLTNHAPDLNEEPPHKKPDKEPDQERGSPHM